MVSLIRCRKVLICIQTSPNLPLVCAACPCPFELMVGSSHIPIRLLLAATAALNLRDMLKLREW